jgi:hypothetical protein
MTEIKDILSALKTLDETTGFEVFIPSLQKEVKFKQLTTEQLKRILKSVVDSPVYNTEFTLSFNDIIKENCLDNTVTTQNFTIYDKIFILLKTRIESISSDFNYIFTKEEKDENNLKLEKTPIDLSSIYQLAVKNYHTLSEELIEQDQCSIKCNLPSLLTENKLEKELHKNVKLEVESPEELRNIIGETFINEVTKFISSIKVNDTSIDLTSIDFKNRIKIVEQLPTNLINKVIKYIETYRNDTKKILNFTVSVKNEQDQTITLDKDLSLDASLFNM